MLKIDISGDTMIFAKDYNGKMLYSTSLSKKDKDGEWENGFIPVQFRRGVAVANKTKIEIQNAWLSFYKDKDKRTVPYIFISEFEGGDEIPEGFAALDDMGIPF